MKYKPTTVVCTADQVAMNGVPDEIKLLPLGMVHNQKQDFIVDDESCQMIIDNFKGRRLDLVIDYEHQTLKDVQAPAAGWIKELRKGTDAIMAKVNGPIKARSICRTKNTGTCLRWSWSERWIIRRRHSILQRLLIHPL